MGKKKVCLTSKTRAQQLTAVRMANSTADVTAVLKAPWKAVSRVDGKRLIKAGRKIDKREEMTAESTADSM